MLKVSYFDVLNFPFVSVTLIPLDIEVKWDGKNDKKAFIP
jgi:hypothetical protein